ncbi:MAG: DUF6036 family nucleotidyltransferase [Gemmatimonadaceae bacterium]
MDLSREAIADALTRVGERLHAEGQAVALVIAGGAALSLLGIIERATSDVDVIAWSESGRSEDLTPPPPQLPGALRTAVDAVGKELGLAFDWFDLRVATEWQLGLPEGFAGRVTWKVYGRALRVGIAAREDLIYFKLVAAADALHPRHYRDLIQLKPSDPELTHAMQEAMRTNVGIDDELARVAGRVREARGA